MATTDQQFFLTVPSSAHGGVDADELARLGVRAEDVIDFSSNQSPLGASPRVAAAVAGAVTDAYPDRDARPLAAAIAAHHGVDPAQVVVGNGSTELIRLIAQLALRPREQALALAPTFGEYEVATKLSCARYKQLYYKPGEALSGCERIIDSLCKGKQPRIFWWCSPNNPTGMAFPAEDIAYLISAFPNILFVLDEAYCDLLSAPQWSSHMLEAGNLIVLRSMTKAWGLAGLRLGYALGAVPLMAALRAAKPPWNVNACAQAAGLAALADTAHYQRGLALLREQKTILIDGLRARGFVPEPSSAAFFLLRVGDAAAMKRRLLAHGCLVRDCASFGLPDYIRISPRRPEHNQQLLAAFDREVR